jgi:hypothetical protein
MTKQKIHDLKQQYNNAVNAYLVAFSKKYKLDVLDIEWVSREYGVGYIFWADMYITFDDLKEDVDKNYNFFYEWYWAGVDYLTKNENAKIINQKSWEMGARYEMLKK